MILLLLATYPFPPDMEDQMDRYIHALLTENYPETERVVGEFRSRLGRHPLVYLLEAARLQFYMVDYFTDSGQSRLFALCDTALQLAREMEGEEPALAHMYMGTALGLKAIQYARRKDVIRTLKYSKEAYDNFARANQEDPELYGCYLALGLYDLAMSYITKYIPWAPSQDRRRKAEERLRLASQRAGLFGPFALIALAYMYAFEGDVPGALRHLSILEGLYPGSRTLLWTKAQACYWGENWGMAYGAYQRVAERVAREQPDCHACRAEALYYMAECAWRLGNPERAKELLAQFWEELDQERSPHRERKVRELRDMARGLSKKLGV